MSEELLSGIIKFLNHSFGKFKSLTKISELNDPEYIDKILRDAENNFFLDMNYLPSDSDFNKQYNLRIIYNRITSYYQYVIKKELDPNYFNYKETSDENFLKLGELILGICAKSQKAEYFEVLNTLSENESNEIFKLLGDLIPLEDEKDNNKSKNEPSVEEVKENEGIAEEDEDDKANEIAMLWIRAENAEKENERMNQEMNELHDKITELTKSNYTLELNLKETESKYKELISSLKKEETLNERQHGNDMNLSIKISELKGKLEAKTKSFYEYQEEKEKLIDEMNIKINTLRKENLSLKEIKVKYDVLQNELKKLSIENMSTIKQRLSQCERALKEKDEEITRLKSNNNQEILLKKIEELNKQNSLLEEENNNLTEENDNIKQQLALKDCEITQLKENLGIDDLDENNENENKNDNEIKKEENKEKNSGISLGNLVEEEQKDKIKNEDFMELEQKVAELIKEKKELENKIKLLEDNLTTEKNENEKLKENNNKLIQEENFDKNEKIKNFEKIINELKEELKKEKDALNSKIKNIEIKNDELKKENLDKNEKIKNFENIIDELKKEKDALNSKIKELDNKIKTEKEKMEQKLEKHKRIKEENKTFVKKIAELMDKLDELKNANMKLTNEKNEIRNEHISTISKLEKDIAEFDFKLKEKENIIKKLETEKEKKKEIDNTALRLQTLELKNSINSESNEKLKEIEEKLKLLTEKESTELKEQLNEKEMNYKILEEKYKKLEEELTEMNKAMNKVPEEIKKREDSIEYYKTQLEFKEKTHNEELRILSSLYHKLSYRFAQTRNLEQIQNFNSLNI